MSNLWRNVALTLAAVLTVAVTLALSGTAILVSRGADRATEQFENGVEFIVFMNPDATEEQSEAIRTPSIPARRSQEQGVRRPAGDLCGVPGDLQGPARTVRGRSPRRTCLRRGGLCPSNVDADAVEDLAGQFEGRPGVKKVVTASEAIEFIDELTRNRVTVVLLGSLILIRCVGLAHPDHDVHRDAGAPPRDRSDEARRRHQLVHSGALRAGGAVPRAVRALSSR